MPPIIFCRQLAVFLFLEIKTPQVVDRKLWEASGHWDKYRENMFITEIDEEHANEKRTNALKPMNCPCHVQVYNHGLKSYKDLPIRFAEFGSCHRYEASGTLHGLMRVRGFTQDDGHIFCTKNMSIVLSKTSYTHQPMKCSRCFISMTGTKLSKPYRQIFV